MFIEWKKKRNFSWGFSEVRLNYLELRKEVIKYLSKTKDFHLTHTITISIYQKKLLQRLSNFLFSCDKFFDNNNIKKYDSEIHSFFLHLRNYVAHKSQFPLISILSFHKTENIRFETFSKQKILEYLDSQIENPRNRKSQSLCLAKNFTLNLEKNPNILTLIDEYFNSIKDEFSYNYLGFFEENEIEFESFFKEISKITEENKKLKVLGLVPPLRDSEIRLIQYLIKKSKQI